jgi:hypothetical protein
MEVVHLFTAKLCCFKRFSAQHFMCCGSSVQWLWQNEKATKDQSKFFFIFICVFCETNNMKVLVV